MHLVIKCASGALESDAILLPVNISHVRKKSGYSHDFYVENDA